MAASGKTTAREEILGAVWGYEHDLATNVVDVYIGYLRRKLHRPGDPAHGPGRSAEIRVASGAPSV
jgi:DNA-binding response OmpR family regulator